MQLAMHLRPLSLTRCSQGTVLSREKREDYQGNRFYAPLKALCPVAERIVAAVYLASATLRSFRHSCSGRPPSLPAALVIARLYPASLQRSASSPRPNRSRRRFLRFAHGRGVMESFGIDDCEVEAYVRQSWVSPCVHVDPWFCELFRYERRDNHFSLQFEPASQQAL